MITEKCIVLTGANSGIGLETLKLLNNGTNRILAVDLRTNIIETMGDRVIPFVCNVGSADGVEAIFARAEELFDKIDIFYCNAGFPYYELYDYTDWQRIDRMFLVNTYSPMYTYSRYLKHLSGRQGHLCFTISAMGQMGMPGYSVYGATKFALEGFAECIRIEMPKNLKLTTLYPVATATNFFKTANDKGIVEKPFPVQTPQVVARKLVRGLQRGSKRVYPCGLFTFAKILMAHFPFVRTIYWNMEKKKLDHFLEGLNK